jgi:hypothetical protein
LVTVSTACGSAGPSSASRCVVATDGSEERSEGRRRDEPDEASELGAVLVEQQQHGKLLDVVALHHGRMQVAVDLDGNERGGRLDDGGVGVRLAVHLDARGAPHGPEIGEYGTVRLLGRGERLRQIVGPCDRAAHGRLGGSGQRRRESEQEQDDSRAEHESHIVAAVASCLAPPRYSVARSLLPRRVSR